MDRRSADLDRDACYRAVAQRDPRFDGRFFTGVKTTGIYCRPICPARTPRTENVTFFPTAAAAQEAGFRPCLRCRPETAPDLGAWRGTSNTVSRALALIELGALDERRLEGLRRAARHRRAPAAAAVPAASRRLADRGRANPPRAAREAAHPRDPAADGRDRVCRRLRQHPPLQRDVSDAVRPRRRASCAARARRTCRRPQRRDQRCCSAITRHTTGRRCSAFLRAARDRRHRDRHRRSLQPHDRSSTARKGW